MTRKNDDDGDDDNDDDDDNVEFDEDGDHVII
jgi:hypothetical protein